MTKNTEWNGGGKKNMLGKNGQKTQAAAGMTGSWEQNSFKREISEGPLYIYMGVVTY